jgi:hypothetical protein
VVRDLHPVGGRAPLPDDVDVSSYPAHYRMLLHEFAQTWTLEPVPGGTRIRLAFDGAVKLGDASDVAPCGCSVGVVASAPSSTTTNAS